LSPQRFGERCSTAAAVREQHGRGESVYDAAPPDAVLFCESTARFPRCWRWPTNTMCR
jgi:hypothetical protein